VNNNQNNNAAAPPATAEQQQGEESEDEEMPLVEEVRPISFNSYYYMNVLINIFFQPEVKVNNLQATMKKSALSALLKMIAELDVNTLLPLKTGLYDAIVSILRGDNTIGKNHCDISLFGNRSSFK
jgi:hypothetical protein